MVSRDEQWRGIALMPVRAFVLALAALYGLFVVGALAVLVAKVSGTAHPTHLAQLILKADCTVASVLVLIAMIMWSQPDWRGLPPGVTPVPTGRVTGYLLRNADAPSPTGRAGMDGKVPPFQIFLAWLIPALACADMRQWIGVAAAVVTLVLLIISWRRHRVSKPGKAVS